ASEIGPDLVYALAKHVAVGPREIYVLEDAVRERRRRERLDRPHPLGADDEDLAGLDVTQVRRADEIHGARFGADDHRIAEAAERERPEAVRIADGNHAVARQHHQRERPTHL